MLNRICIIVNLLFVLLPPQVENSNILFVTFFPAPSHQIVFQAIWKELSLQGHKVYVITSNPLKDPALTNLTEIDISSVYKKIASNETQAAMKQLTRKPSFAFTFLKQIYATKIYLDLTEFILRHENVQEFLKQEHRFDVCIVEWLFPILAGFAAKYDCPLAGVTSTGAPIISLDTVGNPSHPAYVPDHNLPVGSELTFRERLMSSLYSVYIRSYFNLFVLPKGDELVKKYLGKDLPYLGDILTNVSLLLLNRNPVFHRVMPTVPAVIQLGGIQLNRTQEELSSELKEFLDNSKNGVIYFSLGSTVKSVFLPDEQRNIFLKTFSQLEYDVVWKWENDTLPGKTRNILIQKWLPQTELLKHPKVRLFITSGGQQSLEDAIKSHVPIFGIPFATDQTHNVDSCRKHGMGVWMDLDDITIDSLNSSIHEIISNQNYKNNAVYLATLMADQPIESLKLAVWWIEFVIRHKGAKHLRSLALDISWFEYFFLDIILFFVTLLVIVVIVFRKFLKLVCFIRKKLTIKKKKT